MIIAGNYNIHSRILSYSHKQAMKQLCHHITNFNLSHH